MQATTCDVIVVGAGAAGLMCAITAGRRGLSVRVLDHTNRVGKKILMSGGGYCNFTNLGTGPEHFLSENPHFCKSALSRFTPWDFLDWIDKHRIAYREKAAGQLFCVEKAQVIIDMLLDEAEQANVQLSLQTTVMDIEQTSAGFRVVTQRGDWCAPQLVVATGGYSVPTTGATGWGFDFARAMGLKVIETRAGLVPFTFDPELLSQTKPLSGISADTWLEIENDPSAPGFRENILFTHRGLSGPAVLQLSSYWQPGQHVCANLVPQQDLSEALYQAQQQTPTQQVQTVLGRLLAKKLVQAMLPPTEQGRTLASYRRAELQQLAERFAAWRFLPAGTEGYRTAEVTLGGVDTRQLSSKTMACTSLPGLYFIGEVVDVSGQLGGYNFQWAWASGHAAGTALS